MIKIVRLNYLTEINGLDWGFALNRLGRLLQTLDFEHKFETQKEGDEVAHEEERPVDVGVPPGEIESSGDVVVVVERLFDNREDVEENQEANNEEQVGVDDEFGNGEPEERGGLVLIDESKD